MKTKEQKQVELGKKRAKEVKETTSIRISSSEKAVIEKKANAKGMTTSSYIAFAAVHGCEGVTPAIKVRYQNVINQLADALKPFAPEKAKHSRLEAETIWDL